MEAWYEGNHLKGKEMKVRISKECWLRHMFIDMELWKWIMQGRKKSDWSRQEEVTFINKIQVLI
jgi:hypothetical protein